MNAGQKNTDYINVVIIEPDKAPRRAWIKNDLETLQGIVGGYIECVSCPPKCCLIVNEEGLLMGLPFNKTMASIGLYLAGTVIIAGVGGEDFISAPIRTMIKNGERRLYV